MDYAFNPCKMTYKMILFVQKNILFLGFYFDHVMVLFIFLFIFALAYFWWSLYFYLFCVTLL